MEILCEVPGYWEPIDNYDKFGNYAPKFRFSDEVEQWAKLISQIMADAQSYYLNMVASYRGDNNHYAGLVEYQCAPYWAH